MLLYSLVLPMVRGLSLFLFPGVGEDRYTGPDTCGDGSNYRSNYRRVFEWPPDEDCAVGTVAGGMVVTAMGCMTVGTGGGAPFSGGSVPNTWVTWPGST